MEIVKKATEHEENRTYLVKKMNFLPVLANILPICSDKNEQKSLLILIQDLCLKNKIKSGEGFVTNFLSHLVSIIVADEEDVSNWRLVPLREFEINKFQFHIYRIWEDVRYQY